MDNDKHVVSPNLAGLALESEIGNLAKGAFIVALGHRLREPMNSVSGMLRLLESSSLDPTSWNI